MSQKKLDFHGKVAFGEEQPPLGCGCGWREEEFLEYLTTKLIF